MSNDNGLTGAAEAAHHRETRNPERSEGPNTAEAASESNPRLGGAPGQRLATTTQNARRERRPGANTAWWRRPAQGTEVNPEARPGGANHQAATTIIVRRKPGLATRAPEGRRAKQPNPARPSRETSRSYYLLRKIKKGGVRLTIIGRTVRVKV